MIPSPTGHPSPPYIWTHIWKHQSSSIPLFQTTLVLTALWEAMHPPPWMRLKTVGPATFSKDPADRYSLLWRTLLILQIWPAKSVPSRQEWISLWTFVFPLLENTCETNALTALLLELNTCFFPCAVPGKWKQGVLPGADGPRKHAHKVGDELPPTGGSPRTGWCAV